MNSEAHTTRTTQSDAYDARWTALLAEYGIADQEHKDLLLSRTQRQSPQQNLKVTASATRRDEILQKARDLAREWGAMATEGEPANGAIRDQLTPGLSRWDDDSGATLSVPEDDTAEVLAKEEERILQCLGAAVIARWNDLPTITQRALFEHAGSMGGPRHVPRLREAIARFLHNHKDDGAPSYAPKGLGWGALVPSSIASVSASNDEYEADPQAG